MTTDDQLHYVLQQVDRWETRERYLHRHGKLLDEESLDRLLEQFTADEVLDYVLERLKAVRSPQLVALSRLGHELIVERAHELFLAQKIAEETNRTANAIRNEKFRENRRRWAAATERRRKRLGNTSRTGG